MRERWAGWILGIDTVGCAFWTGHGEVVEEGRIATTEAALRRRFESVERMRIAIEVATHSRGSAGCCLNVGTR